MLELAGAQPYIACVPTCGRHDPRNAGADRRPRPPGPCPRAARNRARDRTAPPGARRDGRAPRADRARAAGSSRADRARAVPGRQPAASDRDRPARSAWTTSAAARGGAQRPPDRSPRDRPEDGGEAGRGARAGHSFAAAGMLLNRALALEAGLAEALGGVPPGDPRRMRDASEHFAVVCATERPDEALDRFEALGQVVSIVERGERRVVGVTVEGVPVEVVTADPARFGTELVRATGSGQVRRGARAAPDAADEEGVYEALGVPWCPPELREEPFRGDRLARRAAVRSAATSTATRRGRTARRPCSRWPRRPASSATSTSRSATTRRRWAPSRASMPTTCCVRPTRSPRRTRCWRRSAS